MGCSEDIVSFNIDVDAVVGYDGGSFSRKTVSVAAGFVVAPPQIPFFR